MKISNLIEYNTVTRISKVKW